MDSCFNECLKHEYTSSLDSSKSDESHSIEDRQQNGGGPLEFSPRDDMPSRRGSTIIGIAWASRERGKFSYSTSRVPGKELWKGG